MHRDDRRAQRLIGITVALATLSAGLAVARPPLTATAATVHVWAFGDHSRCPNGQGANPAARDVVAVDNAPLLMLGDQATPSGSIDEYNNCFDPVWGALKPRMKPVPGNHEYNTPGAAGYFEYFDPIPKYYAWEINGWRMYALNSMCGYAGGCSATGLQYRWLEAELRTHPGVCQAAYWHHPRWSQGGHGNIDKMAPVYDLLVRYGVELLLVAHENGVYERYRALDANGVADPRGVTEFVVSTGGVDDGAGEVVPNPPSPVAREDGTMGALRLDLTPSSWSARFVPEAGESYSDSASGTCFDEGDPPPGDTAPPTSSVTSPARNTKVPSPVAFSGQATDDVGVDRVRVAIRDQATRLWLQSNGTWAATFRQFDATLSSRGAASTGWTFSRALPAGQYGVSVRAVDKSAKQQTPDTWVTFSV